ncbi:HNH endonuclease family protein [Actinoplanes sp. NPDC051859]|uniref:HNH endonuclease family protein n=1 Tax=Actinoplanes sp. NPDC051859 TaxID=3363909 RepID=UPI0037AAE5E4
MRRTRATVVVAAAFAAAAVVTVPAFADEKPTPVVAFGGGGTTVPPTTADIPPVPAVPSKAEAQEQLNALTVGAEGSGEGYEREKFPHWENQEGSCNTRETVLQRDGDGVVVDNSCQATSGTWHSPYDGETWTDAQDVDIDHLVPLAEAWRSGAADWTTERREQFANDLTHPQLWAVTDDLNQAKGDQDPAEWQPPLEGFKCDYVKMWITVKHTWELTAQEAEKTALQQALEACSA